MGRKLVILLIVLGSWTSCPAIKVTGFFDTDTFIKRSRDIIIAKCMSTRRNPYPLSPVQVEITSVLKGDREPGSFKIATIYDMQAGRYYLLASMGGSAHGTDFLAVPELAVVPVPSRFDFDSLKGKGVKEQLHLVFSGRLREVERQLDPLLNEQELLKKALQGPSVSTAKADESEYKPILYRDGKIHRFKDRVNVRQDARDEDLKGIKELKGVRSLTMGGFNSGAAGPYITDEGLAHIQGWKQLRSLTISHLDISDKGLKYLAGLSNLKKLNLLETQITNAGLVHLSGLTKLKELWLDFNPQLSDAGLVHLQNLKRLKVLRFFQSPITDAGFMNLKGMKNLEDLQVGKSRITDRSMKLISGMKKLRTLDLQGTRITDAGLVNLESLAELRWLCLKDTAVTDAGIKSIRNLTKLEWLFLGNTKITDVGLSHLSELENLKSLHISKTGVTNKGLEHLSKLRDLERMEVYETKITSSGIQAFKARNDLRSLQVRRTP